MNISAEDMITADKLNVLYDIKKYKSFCMRYKEIAPDGTLEYGIKLLLEPREELPLIKATAHRKHTAITSVKATLV